MLTLLLALVLSGTEVIQPVYITTGPEEVKAKVFTDALNDHVRDFWNTMGPDTHGYRLYAGTAWVQGEAVFYAKLIAPDETFIAWKAPASSDPRAVACEMAYNVHLALASAEHCLSMSKPCEDALREVTPCGAKKQYKKGQSKKGGMD